MKFKPTIEQLTTWAAMLDAKLSPDEAVRRALQLFEAADRLLRADEIADEKAEEQLRAQYEDFTENFPGGRGLSVADALKELERNPVGKRIKSEGGLLRALRKGQFAYNTKGVWITSPKLLNEFREMRLQAERERKRKSKEKMGGSSHPSKRKTKSEKRNARAAVPISGGSKQARKRKSNR